MWYTWNSAAKILREGSFPTCMKCLPLCTIPSLWWLIKFSSIYFYGLFSINNNMIGHIRRRTLMVLCKPMNGMISCADNIHHCHQGIPHNKQTTFTNYTIKCLRNHIKSFMVHQYNDANNYRAKSLKCNRISQDDTPAEDNPQSSWPEKHLTPCTT